MNVFNGVIQRKLQKVLSVWQQSVTQLNDESLLLVDLGIVLSEHTLVKGESESGSLKVGAADANGSVHQNAVMWVYGIGEPVHHNEDVLALLKLIVNLK